MNSQNICCGVLNTALINKVSLNDAEFGKVKQGLFQHIWHNNESKILSMNHVFMKAYD